MNGLVQMAIWEQLVDLVHDFGGYVPGDHILRGAERAGVKVDPATSEIVNRYLLSAALTNIDLAMSLLPALREAGWDLHGNVVAAVLDAADVSIGRSHAMGENRWLRKVLKRICSVDKSSKGRRDCDIWADMLAEASDALRHVGERADDETPGQDYAQTYTEKMNRALLLIQAIVLEPKEVANRETQMQHIKNIVMDALIA